MCLLHQLSFFVSAHNACIRNLYEKAELLCRFYFGVLLFSINDPLEFMLLLVLLLLRFF